MKQDEEYLLYKEGFERGIKDWSTYYRRQVTPCADFGLSEIQLPIFPWKGKYVYPGVFEGCAYGSLIPIGVVFEQYFQLLQQRSRQPLFERLEDYSFIREVPSEPAEILELPAFEKSILEFPHPALTDFARAAIPEPSGKDDCEDEEADFDLVNLSPARLPVYLTSATCFGLDKTACNIPPHNLAEIVDLLEAKLQNPKNRKSNELLSFMQGPDFSCGGTVIFSDKEAKNLMYAAGKGKYTFKCDYSIVARPSDSEYILFKVIDSSFALKNLNLALERGVVSGIRSATISSNDDVEVRPEKNLDMKIAAEAISALPGFTVELVYNSTLFLNRKRENRNGEQLPCEQLPLENILEIFIDSRIKYLRTLHRCSRSEAVSLYSAELANFKSQYSKPRLTKILYSEV